MTNEELASAYVDAGVGLAGLRAVYNAALTRAAEIARRQDYGDKLPASTEGDRTSDARARSIAAAIDAEKEKGNG